MDLYFTQLDLYLMFKAPYYIFVVKYYQELYEKLLKTFYSKI